MLPPCCAMLIATRIVDTLFIKFEFGGRLKA
jgi:hypothetical protein